MEEVRHGNGLVEIKRKSKTSWGIDTHVDGNRVRKLGLASREEAEDVLVNVRDMEGSACTDGVKIGSIGAIAELLVCADLLKQGFDVFRSVSINAACDLIALNQSGQFCRIEVKSAVVRNGGTRFKRHRFDRTKHDVLALVFLRRQQIEYSISLKEWFDSDCAKPHPKVA